jgi:regulator of CtrA degradation
MSQNAQFVAFFDGPFREGMDLLESARDYLADPAGDAFADRRSMMQLVVSCETMRLTARLAQITAWLLMQRAVYAGEVAPLEACKPENRLGSPDVCGVPGPWRMAEVPLPERLQDLLDRSLGLYQRIARLDEMVCLRAETMAAEDVEAPGVSPSDRDPGTAS